jgi:hypothetical protein
MQDLYLSHCSPEHQFTMGEQDLTETWKGIQRWISQSISNPHLSVRRRPKSPSQSSDSLGKLSTTRITTSSNASFKQYARRQTPPRFHSESVVNLDYSEHSLSGDSFPPRHENSTHPNTIERQIRQLEKTVEFFNPTTWGTREHWGDLSPPTKKI